MRLRVIANEQIVIVGIRAAIEAYVRAIVTSAAHGRILITKMAAIHVVVGRVNESVLDPILRLAGVGIEKELPCVRHERLRHKRRLFVNVQSRAESSKFVVLIDELT